MTLSAINPWVHYATDGLISVFAYPFPVAAASDLEAYKDGSLVSNYTVSGVGSASGGNVTFTTPPTAGVLFIRRKTPLTQLTDYVDNDAFSASAHEGALDKIVRMIQDLQEEISRRPDLATHITSTFRNLSYPTPAASKLWGWNSVPDAITYYDPAIVQVTVDPVSGLANGKTTITVAASAALQLTASAGVPAGCLHLGTTGRVTVALGATNGLTTWSLGESDDLEKWATGQAIALDTVTNAGQWKAYQPQPNPSAKDILITADAGQFDTTGELKITSHWQTFTADS